MPRVVVLTGCSGESEGAQNIKNSTETLETTSTSSEVSSNSEVTSESEENSEQVVDSSQPETDITSYEELDAQNYFNPADYETHLATDNPNTRVFIFRKGDKSAYKTVFIKHDNRLKVIDIANDELLMNKRI